MDAFGAWVWHDVVRCVRAHHCAELEATLKNTYKLFTICMAHRTQRWRRDEGKMVSHKLLSNSFGAIGFRLTHTQTQSKRKLRCAADASDTQHNQHKSRELMIFIVAIFNGTWTRRAHQNRVFPYNENARPWQVMVGLATAMLYAIVAVDTQIRLVHVRTWCNRWGSMCRVTNDCFCVLHIWLCLW